MTRLGSTEETSWLIRVLCEFSSGIFALLIVKYTPPSIATAPLVVLALVLWLAGMFELTKGPTFKKEAP
jgi:hypothetical protein